MGGKRNVYSVPVPCAHPYSVLIENGLLSSVGAAIREVSAPCRTVIITDNTVDPLYGNTVEQALTASGFSVCRYRIPQGEKSKNMGMLTDLLEFSAGQQITRSDLFVALGGGVVGDLAGFAAAIYLRGIRYIQIPTTFLSAIDSSVGGKTAVNLGVGKNLAGAFWQPALVLCDPQTFRTLPADVFAEGVAEGIKYGMISDADLFQTLAGGAFLDRIESVIARCVSIKSALVAEDEFDVGARQLLNLGHTVGHAVEQCSRYEISHGKAVAIGMFIMARAAEQVGKAEPGTSFLLRQALEQNGLPTHCPFGADELTLRMQSDKKRQGDEITLVLPEAIGRSTLYRIPVRQLRDFILKGLEAQR